MNGKSLLLTILPKEQWGELDDPLADISDFVRDALAIERMIRKEVNLANQRMRYFLCSRRIQSSVYRRKDQLETMQIGGGYFDMLQTFISHEKTRMPAITSRLASCFYLPDMIKDHIREFKQIASALMLDDNEYVKKRIEFFQQALDKGAGIVEIDEMLIPGEKSEVAAVFDTMLPVQTVSHTIEYDEYSEGDIRDFESALRAQIERALKSDEPVNFSNQPHFVIAEVLNEYVYKKPEDGSEKYIRVVYMDGSEAEQFPLFCLERPSLNEDNGVQLLRASLVSMRHPEMDDLVDFCWFRNRNVSVSQPYAMTESYCYNETVQIFSSALDKPLLLHLYQTGLETAVVGFYRGLVTTLKKIRQTGSTGSLKVVPMYFNKQEKTYKEGKSWS